MVQQSQCLKHHTEILRMIEEGHNLLHSARTLGVTPSSLRNYCAVRGLKFGRTTKARVVGLDDQKIIALSETGLTHWQIAEALGASESAIERRCKAMGLKTGRTGPRAAAGHPEWKGGRTLDKHAYISVYVPLHPLAGASNGKVPEHRLVKEVEIGRYLTRAEVVDHRDDYPYHNWPSNLNLYACNADHLRATLTGRVKATPRVSIPGAYGSTESIGRCPTLDETLAQCPLEIRQKLVWYIESHRPTNAHLLKARKEFLRTGAWRDPFQLESTE